MTDLNLTIDANFADLAGNTMEASHWTTPLDEIETFLHGLVGRDGVGADNWKADGAVRATGFRKNAVTEVFRLQNSTDGWTVVPETALSGGPPHGVSPSPLPGGYLRYYLRAEAEFVAMFYTAKILDGANGAYDFRSESDLTGTILASSNTTMALSHLSAIRLYWTATGSPYTTAGWHYVANYVVDGSPSTHLVLGPTDLVVVAAYK